MKKQYSKINYKPLLKLIKKHKTQKNRYKIKIGKIELIMIKGVFCPAFTNTSKFFADNISVKMGDNILDMFSGSGYQAIRIAHKAKKIVAIDQSQKAVNCTKENIALHKLKSKIEVRKGNLFDSLRKYEKFNIIIANPPLLPGIPENDLEKAVLSPNLEIIPKFLENVKRYLVKDGTIYLLFSDASKKIRKGLPFIKNLCKKNNFKVSIIAKKNVKYENYFVLRIKNNNF